MKFPRSPAIQIALITCAAIIGVEILLRALWYQRHAENPIAFVRLADYVSQKIFPVAKTCCVGGEGLYEGDLLLSYRHRKGASSTIRQAARTPLQKDMVYSPHIDEQGFRRMTGRPEKWDEELWFFGESFTFGWGVEDDEPYPALIQKKLPNIFVSNFSHNGYGNLQYVIQLLEAVQNGVSKKTTAVFVYSDFHTLRNGRRAWHLERVGVDATFSAPAALEFRPVGQNCLQGLRRKWQLPERKFLTREEAGEGEPTYPALGFLLGITNELHCMVDITKQIFTRLRDISLAHGITPVFAYHNALSLDPVVEYVRQLGYKMVDLTVDPAEPDMTFAPVDGHPSAKAHRYYADAFVRQFKGP